MGIGGVAAPGGGEKNGLYHGSISIPILSGTLTLENKKPKAVAKDPLSSRKYNSLVGGIFLLIRCTNRYNTCNISAICKIYAKEIWKA